MEVHFPPELERKLASIAVEQGRTTESLVFEAIDRLVSHGEWFVREVETGLSAADRGESIEHDAVRSLIDAEYPGG